MFEMQLRSASVRPGCGSQVMYAPSGVGQTQPRPLADQHYELSQRPTLAPISSPMATGHLLDNADWQPACQPRSNGSNSASSNAATSAAPPPARESPSATISANSAPSGQPGFDRPPRTPRAASRLLSSISASQVRPLQMHAARSVTAECSRRSTSPPGQSRASLRAERRSNQAAHCAASRA